MVVSTDSEIYADIAKKYGAEVLFLRSKRLQMIWQWKHVLNDILKLCKINNINPPNNVVWLRPTHPLRSIDSFIEAKEIFDEDLYSVCIVTRTESLFVFKRRFLVPLVKDFHSKSMIRRQQASYRIFTEKFYLLNLI